MVFISQSNKIYTFSPWVSQSKFTSPLDFETLRFFCSLSLPFVMKTFYGDYWFILGTSIKVVHVLLTNSWSVVQNSGLSGDHITLLSMASKLPLVSHPSQIRKIISLMVFQNIPHPYHYKSLDSRLDLCALKILYMSLLMNT